MRERLPDDVGSTLSFPTIQTCEEGETAWIEVPAAGHDADDLDRPAPGFVLTGLGTASTPSAEVALVARDRSSSDSSGFSAVAIVAFAALGVAVVGVWLGVAALTRQRRRS